jgi:hypothetical protein
MPTFTSLTLAAVFSTLAAANPFTLTAYLPGHPVNGQVINAAGLSLFLGLAEPSAFCPSPPVPIGACPSGKKTLFVGGLSMWCASAFSTEKTQFEVIYQ